MTMDELSELKVGDIVIIDNNIIGILEEHTRINENEFHCTVKASCNYFIPSTRITRKATEYDLAKFKAEQTIIINQAKYYLKVFEDWGY